MTIPVKKDASPTKNLALAISLSPFGKPHSSRVVVNVPPFHYYLVLCPPLSGNLSDEPHVLLTPIHDALSTLTLMCPSVDYFLASISSGLTGRSRGGEGSACCQS